MHRLPSFVFRSSLHRRTALTLLATMLTVGCLVSPILAQRSDGARPQPVQVDWAAVARDMQTVSPELATETPELPPRRRARVERRLSGYAVKEGMAPLALLNDALVDVVPGVEKIRIPVLVPFETSRFLGEKASPTLESRPLHPREHRGYLFGAGGGLQLLPGSAGYDALVTYEPEALQALGIASMRRRMVHIAGAALSYGSAEAGELVGDMQAQLPGLRRHEGDNEVAYTFRKYGVPYFAVVSCSNQPLYPNALPCQQAEILLRTAVQNLRLIGGNPLPIKEGASASKPANPNPPRPARVSPDFKYYPPGKLLEGTGDDGMDGSPDRNVYGDILFPIRKAPSYGQPQVFMHWGNCVSSPGTSDRVVPLPKEPEDKHARYRCKQNQKQLLHWEGHPENYAYPWRDNFCESRRGAAGSTPECPAKRGHQGQDIRPSTCPGPADAETCQPDVHEVIAVAAGNACRDGNKIRLKFDTTSLYYVYLHMNVSTLDAAGMKDQHCTPVKAGTVLGKVGNFQDVIGGTSTHLHFEIHPVDPYSRFNPYMTLIRAYERLIGAKGTELP
jgi:hypothetical protein